MTDHEGRARVVHCKREPFDVYIGRPSKWGNPWSHKAGTLAQYQVATIEEAVAKHRAWFLAQPDMIAAAKRELRGKVLGCWGCSPCHGDVYVEVANAD